VYEDPRDVDPATAGDTAVARESAGSVEIPQYSILGILAVWAAAALPMAFLAWVAAPILEDHFSGPGNVPWSRRFSCCSRSA
jgi:hypothetical protein